MRRRRRRNHICVTHLEDSSTSGGGGKSTGGGDGKLAEAAEADTVPYVAGAAAASAAQPPAVPPAAPPAAPPPAAPVDLPGDKMVRDALKRAKDPMSEVDAMKADFVRQVKDPKFSFGPEEEFSLAEKIVNTFRSNAFGKLLNMKGQDRGDAANWPSDPAQWGPEFDMDKQAKDLKPHQKKDYDFWKQLENNNFWISTDGKKEPASASRWQRGLAVGDTKAKYDLVKGESAKALFRQKWAKGEFQVKMAKMVKVTEERREHWRNSQYLSIGRIAHMEGNGRSGWLSVPWPTNF